MKYSGKKNRRIRIKYDLIRKYAFVYIIKLNPLIKFSEIRKLIFYSDDSVYIYNEHANVRNSGL